MTTRRRTPVPVDITVSRVGGCRGDSCTCLAYVQKGIVGFYPTCTCGHTQNTHNTQERNEPAGLDADVTE